MSESQTPRTDAVWDNTAAWDKRRQVSEQLERELNEAKKRYQFCKKLYDERVEKVEELRLKFESSESRLKIATEALENIRGLSGFNPDESAIRTEIYDWADDALNQIKK